MSRKTDADCAHPSGKDLAAYERGELAAEQAAAVEAHLERCALCCDALADLPADAFVVRLRRACEAVPTRLQREPRPPETVDFTLATVELLPAADAPALAGYSDLCELGRGGMGVVYAAVQAALGRRVAIKLIHPEFAGNPAARERFQREVRAAARLAHPNIVTAHDAGESDGRPFLVMEHVAGEDLGERVRRLGPLPVAEAADAVRQAALGVQHAHDHGLVHRDLKPHNLVRTADGTVKVCDFGLAALIDDRGSSPGTTAPNAVMGTPDYMAPEQAENARAADGRAEVYALGCTLYHLLTGRAPFPESSVVLKLLAHRTAARPSVRRVRPEVPAALDAVLRRAMARRPANRFATPGALAEALRPFADPARLARTRWRKRRVLGTALGLGLLAGVVAVLAAALPADEDRSDTAVTDPAAIAPVAANGPVVRSANMPEPTAVAVGERLWLDGYDDAVWGVAFSPDGRYLLTSGRRNNLHGRADLRLVRRVGEGGVWFAGFSPDGRQTLTGEQSMRAVVVSETQTGREVGRLGFPNFAGRVLTAAFAPDGRTVAVSDWDTVRLFDAATRRPGMTVPTHYDARPAFAFTGDGRRLLVVHSDHRSIRTYDVDSGAERGVRLESPGPVSGFAVSADGSTVIASRHDNADVQVWDAATSRLATHRFAGVGPPYYHRKVAFLPGDRRALVTNFTGPMILWEVATGRELDRWAGLGEVVSVAPAPDGRWALCGLCAQKRAFLLRLPEPPEREWAAPRRRPGIAAPAAAPSRDAGGALRCLGGSAEGVVGRVFFLPDGERVLAGGDCPSLWNPRTGEKILSLPKAVEGWPYAVAVSRDGRRALFGCHLVDLETGELVRTLDGSLPRTPELWSVALSPDGRRAAVGCHLGRPTGGLSLMDLETGQVCQRLDRDESTRCVTFSPDGTRVAAGHFTSPQAPYTVRVYSTATGEILHSFPWLRGTACLAFSPDGRQLALASHRVVHLWDLSTEEESRLEGHSSLVEWLAFTPDGRQIVSAGADGTVRAWDVASGRVLACFCGHTDGVLGVSVSPDGCQAISGGRDGTLRLWRLPEGPRGG